MNVISTDGRRVVSLSPATLVWILFPPFALCVGMLLAGSPAFVAGGLVALLVSVWALSAGHRHVDEILYAYVLALATLPTLVLRLESQEIPVALSDFLLVLLAVALLGTRSPAEPMPRHLRVLGRWLLVLNIAILVSIAFIPILSPASGVMNSVLRFLRFFPSLLMFVVFIRVVPDRARIERLISVLMIAIFAQAALGLASFALQTPLLLDPDRRAEQFIWLDAGDAMTRAQGTIAEASSLAHLVGIGCLLAMFSLGFLKGRRILFSAIVFVACAACLVLTYSRGMTLSLVVGAALFLLLTRNGGAPRVAGGLAAAGVALVVLYATGSAYVGSLMNRFAFTSFVSQTQTMDAYLTGRLSLWARLGQFLTENPAFMIFGIGYKSIPTLGPYEATVGDNNYLSILIECGLFGLVSMLGVLWCCLRGGRLLWRSSDQWTRASGALLISLWSMHAAFMLVGDAMTYWRSVPLLFALQFALERASLTGANS